MTRHSALRLAARYITGRRLDGLAQPGRRHLRHIAWRLGTPTALIAGAELHSFFPLWTDAGLAGAGTIGVMFGGRTVRRAWRARRFRRAYVRPTLAALRPTLGDAPVRLHVDPSLGTLLTRLARPMSPAEQAVRGWYGRRVEPAVRWLPDRLQRGAWALQRAVRPVTRPVTAALRRPVEDQGPRIEMTASVPYLTPDQRQYVGAVVGAKIPAGELVEAWDQIGPQVRATWTVRRRPPARVGYADLAARIEQLDEAEFFLGLGVGGRPVTVNLHDDSPHIALSAGSGAGKSVLAQLVAVQVLARGGNVVLLDRKGSHRWALGLAAVDYCTRPEEMHTALVRLAKLADDRNAAALHEEEGWDPGNRVLVIAEELNATMAQIRAWWDEVREKGQPKIPPAVRAFREIMFMGRSAKINLLAIAQMLTAQTTGGPESRENFGVRCLARYTRNAWQMLAPEAAMPRASRTLGRWQIVVGGVATECQVCYLSRAEARLFVHRASPGTRSPLNDADQHLSPGHRPSGDTVPAPETASMPVTLRQAAERGIVPWEHAAAKKRLQRARVRGSVRAPAPVGRDGTADVYRIAELVAWVEDELGVAAVEDR
jgi:hypothetical protein